MNSKNLKKIALIISFVFISTNIFAQTGYYSGTDGQNGTALKSILHSKVRNHIRFPYTSSSTDVWDILKQTDRDPNNSANVLLIYTNYSRSASAEYNNGSGWNREHVWANSHGFPDESDTAYTDAHHLRPADINTNALRGNKDFDNGGTSVATLDNHYDSDSWEPRDDIKGDIARMMLYMTVRYEGGDGYDLELVDYTPSSGANFGKKSTLLEWNRRDPVSAFERNRNRVIYKFQKNYNPFVDHPEFADRVYNSDKLFVEKVEQVSNSSIVVSFSKSLNNTNAENTANYNLDRLGTPNLATPNFGGDAKKVLLSFSSSLADTFYNVRVSNSTSSTGEAIITNSIALFEATQMAETDTTAPAIPANLAANAVNDNIELTWNANTETDLFQYVIYRDVIQDFVPTENNIVGKSSVNQFIDTERVETEVYYKITAVDINGNESGFSTETSATFNAPDTIAPAKPTNLVATHKIDNVELTWDANSEDDFSHYLIYKGAIQNFTPSQYTLLANVAENLYNDEAIVDYRVYYKIAAVDISGNVSEYSDETSILVGINDENTTITKYALEQNYPNPFNPSTVIRYSIPTDVRGEMQEVRLKVYNILGNEVATLVNAQKSAGNYSVNFDASKLSSGIYFYTLSSGKFKETKKMIFIK